MCVPPPNLASPRENIFDSPNVCMEFATPEITGTAPGTIISERIYK